MAYRINGPVTIGDSGALNTVNGNSTFAHSGAGVAAPLQGQVYYVDSSLQLRGLATGTAGNVLITNGAGADPSWTSQSITTNGFSVSKIAADTFSNTQVIIDDWVTTIPAGVTSNPFFNTGAPNFVLATGVYTPSSNGTYHVSITLEYTSTSAADSTTLTFAEQTAGPVFNTILTSGPIQQNPQTSERQKIDLVGTIKLGSGLTYVATVQSSGTTGVKTISANSRFSIVLVAV